MTLNAQWHRRHVMPKNATVEQRVAWQRAHQENCACRPIPAKLLAQMAKAPQRGRTSLRRLLSGGDRRSIAGSTRALSLVEGAPARVAELARLAADPDWLVSMRALDLLEKLAHRHPDWVQPYKRLFIGPLADSDKWEVHLQVVRALPLLRWAARERKRVVEILRRDIQHPQKFVRAWALHGLAILSRSDAALLPEVARHLDAFEHSRSKALAARARKIRQREEGRSRKKGV